MKNLSACLVGIFFLQICSLTQTRAQSKDDPAALKLPGLKIAVDGDLKDWGDSLKYFNGDNHLHYSFSGDKDNLYFAIKIDDRPNAVRILKGGLTLSIDPKGKKKSAYAITFPVNMQVGALPAAKQTDNFNEITQADRDELQRELITTLRGIKVEGFKDIEGDMISTSNSYGIKTYVGYDEKGSLICEVSIALKLLNTEINPKNEWVYDVKINGVARAGAANRDGSTSPSIGMGGGGHGGGGGGGMGGGGGGRGGMGGGRGGRGGGAGSAPAPGTEDNPLSRTAEFSGKFYLANNN